MRGSIFSQWQSSVHFVTYYYLREPRAQALRHVQIRFAPIPGSQDDPGTPPLTYHPLVQLHEKLLERDELFGSKPSAKFEKEVRANTTNQLK